MELLEYQAKELFRMIGIPILPSQTIKDSRKIKQLQIPYPVVLKSQVRSGGRGKAGGVRFVANTIDAIAAARAIFNLPILDEYPEVILAEAHYNTQRELFLAIVLDYDLQCPVLLGSAFGGMNVEALLTNLQQVVVDPDFSLFQARRLAVSMGLSGNLICSVSEIIAKMYCLFQDHDLDLIEINPLGINTQGELMALDGKIIINDYGLARQPVIETLSFSKHQQQISLNNFLNQNSHNSTQMEWRWLDWRNPTGKIAIITNSFDLALLTWDLLHQNKAIPSCGVIINNSLAGESSDLELYQEQIVQILRQIESIEEIKAVLVNILETEPVSRAIIQAIADYCQSFVQSTPDSAAEDNNEDNNKVKSDQNKGANKPKSPEAQVDSLPHPQFILRLLDKDNLEDPITESIYLSSNLETAISQAIATIKSN
ncbi:MAG: ATP-grasp domain-containing protein [Waterburya sp.]